MNIFSTLRDWVVPRDIEEKFERTPKNLGSYQYDPWGYHPDTAVVSLTVVKQFFDHYFRVETDGIENIPEQGRALIIANHSGQLPIDGILIGTAMATADKPRLARAMVERFFPTVPFIGNFLNQTGAVIGDPTNCVRMLENEEAVIVFPEGIRGSGKLWQDRYQLKRFGNGFLHIAMATGTPIIPVGVVGCEETIPSAANLKPLANLLGLPYFPLALPVVLPAKVHLHFGEPLFFENDVSTEDEVTARVEEVKTAITQLIQKGLVKRKGVFV